MATMILPINIPGPFFEGGVIKDAFHGTNETAGLAIMKDGFAASERVDNRYGSGVYFWEGDYLTGFWWAEKRSGPDRGGPPVVIQTEIDLGKTFLLNSIGDQLEGIRLRIGEFYEQDWDLQDVVRLIAQRISQTGKVDTIRAVTRAKESKEYAHRWYRAEVVIVVFDNKRAKPVRLYGKEQMLAGGAELSISVESEQ